MTTIRFQPTGWTPGNGAVSESISGTAAGSSLDTGAISGVGGPELVFASDWSTATGNTQAAVRDGTTWTGNRCSQYLDLLTVISAPSGWPSGMANVLRVGADGASGCGMVTRYDFPIPAVGESIWYRCFLQYISTSNNLANQHFLQPDNPSGFPHPWNWRWQTPFNGGTQVRLEWILVNQLTGWPNTNVLYAVVLTIGTLYRLEWEFERTGSLTAVMRPRIYLGNSTDILFDASDFLDRGEGATDGDPLTASTVQLSLGRAAALSEIELGQNGPASSTTQTNDFFRAGGFAASVTGWCGPYTPGEGD